MEAFKQYLIREEKSPLTVEKYLRDAARFRAWLGEAPVTKERVLRYKEHLVATQAVASVNSALSAVNCWLRFVGLGQCRVKTVRCQRSGFLEESRELNRQEYRRLLAAARGRPRLCLLMQTICATGIRVSEHRFITVESAREGCAQVRMKGKSRPVFLPRKLCRALLDYAKARGITRGSIFVTARGRPLDRCNIWSEMKKLCATARVGREKVFPHNLRHLFARVYYSQERDIVRLADILGHSSINTTRIYTMESGRTHRRQIERMDLLLIT